MTVNNNVLAAHTADNARVSRIWRWCLLIECTVRTDKSHSWHWPSVNNHDPKH